MHFLLLLCLLISVYFLDIFPEIFLDHFIQFVCRPLNSIFFFLFKSGHVRTHYNLNSLGLALVSIFNSKTSSNDELFPLENLPFSPIHKEIGHIDLIHYRLLRYSCTISFMI